MGLLGSDANFIAVRCTAPEGRAGGTMNLDSDPKNPRVPPNAAIRPKNGFIAVPLVFNAALGGHTGFEVVLDQRHLGHCVGQLNQFGGRATAS